MCFLVYFIGLIGNGIHARGIIRIGDIRHINRICEAVYLFYLLNESNELIKDGSIFMGNEIYSTKKDGEIIIPFTNNPNSKQKIILQRNDDRYINI